MKDVPKFYNDLKLTLEEIFHLLKRGVRDRKSGFHNVVLVTTDKENRADGRTVVLRGFDSEKMEIYFHSDLRAKKISQIKNNNFVSLIFYDEKKKIQIRIKGEASIKPSYKKAWDGLSNWSKRCYLTISAPGESSENPTAGFPEKFEFTAPNDKFSKKGIKNFCYVVISITKVEWLFLASQGHRRALFDISKSNSKIEICSKWLVP